MAGATKAYPSIWRVVVDGWRGKAPARREPIVVDLYDLAQLWLKYNRQFVQQRHDEEPSYVSGEAVQQAPEESERSGYQQAPPRGGGEEPKAQNPQQASRRDNGNGAGPDCAEGLQGPGDTDLPLLAAAKQQQPRTTTGATAPPVIESSAFYRDLIEPFKDRFIAQNAFEGTCRLIELIDRYGGCPSIVDVSGDCEADDIGSIAGLLRQVTLRNHTYRVARIAIKLLEESVREFEHFTPKMLVIALGHDAGKIPEVRTREAYAKGDHPIASAAKVAEIFEGCDISWMNSALEAIRAHHRHATEQFAVLLRKADGLARQIEITEGTTTGLVQQEWAEWFDAGECLSMLAPHVNVSQTNKWKAFTHGSVVYCQPDFLYETARELAVKKGVMDILVYRLSDKEVALRKIIASLRDAGVLAGDVADGYIGRKFEVVSSVGKKKSKFVLLPINVEAIGQPSELEARKQGWLTTIRDVIPVKK